MVMGFGGGDLRPRPLHEPIGLFQSPPQQMVLVRQVLDRPSQLLHLAPLLAVVLLLLALHDLDAVRQFQERVGDVLGGRVHPGCLCAVSPRGSVDGVWAVAAGGGQQVFARDGLPRWC